MKKPEVIKGNRNLFVESSLQRVLEVFFTMPDKELSLSEAASLSRVKKSNIGGFLRFLEKEEFIIIEMLNNLWRIQANLRSRRFLRSKIIYNLSLIYQSELIDFLTDYYSNPKAIILFGSFRKGEDISTSDIDIAVEHLGEYEVIRLNGLAGLEKVFKRNIQIHLFNPKKTDRDIFTNIANGIILSGFLGLK